MSDNETQRNRWSISVLKHISFDHGDIDEKVADEGSIFERGTHGSPDEAVDFYKRMICKTLETIETLEARTPGTSGGVWILEIEKLGADYKAIKGEEKKIAVIAARYNKATKLYDVSYVQPNEVQKVLDEEKEAAKERAELSPINIGGSRADEEWDEEIEDQEYECKVWWEIRNVRSRGFDVDTKDWSSEKIPHKIDYAYDDPEQAADAFFDHFKTDTEQAVMDDTFGECMAIDVQNVREVRKLDDGKYSSYVDVDVEGNRYKYFITKRWNKDHERYDLAFVDAEEVEEIFREEGKAAEQRRRSHDEKDSKRGDPEPAEDLDPEIEM